MAAIINELAPQPVIECWAQGYEPPINELAGKVVLIEVIQVNCPGCFVHALPEVIRLHENYADSGLKVFVIATAFEHFEKNTMNNLNRLLQHGELQGDPLAQLSAAGFLENNKLPYSIPFSVAMDKLVKRETSTSQASTHENSASEASTCENRAREKEIKHFILRQIPDFYTGSLNEKRQQAIIQQVKSYLSIKTHDALTFEMYQLQGTPSSILIDKRGLLRQVSFGAVNQLEKNIKDLVKE